MLSTKIESSNRRLKGKDLISVGIYSAVYFVINFIFMLLGGIHPILWILMPGLIALFAGIPFLLMCAKVQKPGAVFLMGIITGLIYFITGQFTVLILTTFVTACGLAELSRYITKYHSFGGNAAAYVFFSMGMVGSPLPIWVMKSQFLAQISSQGIPADYVDTLRAISSPAMLVVMVLAPAAGGIAGVMLTKGMLKKHFVKAGII